MSEPPKLRPIWSPEDVQQTAAELAAHTGIPGVQADPGEPYLPFLRNPSRFCDCCAAWPDEPCDPDCLSQMTVEEQEQHRTDVLDHTLNELGLTQSPVPMSPPRGRRRAAEPARMRPRRAAQLTKMTIAVAAIILMLVVGVLWAAHLGALPR